MRLFIQSIGRYLALWPRALWPPAHSPARRSPRRLLVMLVFLPAFGVLQLINWLGLLLDEVFFRGYRRVAVREPVFVTGVPRSGTTLVHRTMALDSRFTTFAAWECLFAPSVTQRYLFRALARMDRWFGRPLARLLDWLQRRMLGGLDDVHGMRLDDPEEDYFVFMPLVSCFILIVPFPDARWLWDIGQFDRRLDDACRSRLMRHYRRCVQKHLYVHGRERVFLSKNASFPPLLGSLHAEFPDARLVCCLRDPMEVVPSQLSSLRDGMAFFGNDPYDAGFRDRIIELLAFYYRKLFETPFPDEQRAWVEMNDFRNNLVATTESVYAGLGLELSDTFRRRLKQAAAAARRYRSRHVYRLDEFGLDESKLRKRFVAVARPGRTAGAGTGG